MRQPPAPPLPAQRTTTERSGARRAGSLNSEFTYVSSTSQIKVLNSDRVAKTCPDATNCCLVAKPCVHPCVLPMGWGALFLILFVAGCCGYVSAGVVYAVKVEGKDPAAGAHTHPPSPCAPKYGRLM